MPHKWPAKRSGYQKYVLSHLLVYNKMAVLMEEWKEKYVLHFCPSVLLPLSLPVCSLSFPCFTCLYLAHCQPLHIPVHFQFLITCSTCMATAEIYLLLNFIILSPSLLFLLFSPSQGTFISWFSGEMIAGPQNITRNFTLSEIPVYVRAGAIIPMKTDDFRESQ